MLPDLPPCLFRPDQLDQLTRLLDVDPAQVDPDLAALDDGRLAEVEVLVTGWGAPRLDAALLARLPRLGAVVHTAGSVKSLFDDAAAAAAPASLRVTSAVHANAIPVAEYTLAQILLAGKRTLASEADYRRRRRVDPDWYTRGGYGNHGGVVGLIGASHIGRLVASHLRPFDVQVLLYDPFVSAAQAAELGTEKVELADLFSRSDVVSLHAPDVPATHHMVDAGMLALMRDGTTFINTARPALVHEEALRAELVSGRISAVLDVHDSLPADDPIWELRNVSITPHLAGSQGNELHRLANTALTEIAAYVGGHDPVHPVDLATLATLA
ncbi:hydroxyacid dehydrogenase [Pseudactinotalea sp. HY160]|nr:hydroxyacid dehydrogenase [Pseudactinotalea sp. HY160]MPV50872.1 hydroxyacid dehydrogenase [Pseudactinotalea sp. HY160]QGH71148.1 hydroxyacid dehydrogenase [Pseudactinotalea sp. HY158]